MQPFQVPRPNTIPGGARPGPPGRIPGPQPGARPGVPRPGMPGPMGVKPQIPSNIGVNPTVTNPIPQEEKPKEPVETIQQEPVQEEVPEQKAEPIKTEPPIKGNRPGPPQFGQKPMPKPGMKPGPPFGQPQPMTKQPEPVMKQPEIPTKQVEPEPVSQRKPSLKPEIEPPQQKPPVQLQQQEVEQIPQRKPSYKQEVVEQPIPQRKPSFQPEPQERNEPPIPESHHAVGSDSSNDRLLRLSESLQAMKDLRSNFQGFNNAEEDEQEEEQYGEEEYIEEDDYVRVEGTEDEEGLGDTANEGQRYSEENQEEEEDNQNQDYQEEEEDYEPEDQGNSESQNQLAEPQYPPQIIEEETPEATPKANIEASPERKLPPPMAKTLPPTGAVGMRPSPHGSAGLRPGSAGIQPVGSAGIKPQSAGIQPGLIPKEQTPAGGMNSPFREEKNIIHHQPQHRSKYATESQELLTSHEGIGHESGKKDSDYERIEHEAAAAGGRNDPNLILKLERLELELEKEKKKSALLEEQQERVLNENLSLKQKNAELTARLELANKRTTASEYSSSHPESDALKEELTRSLEETRQISENAQRMMQEASQYREETEAFISTLEAEKNDLYQQVVQLKRQIDEDYIHQIESYKQRTDLLERKIKEHENNFNMVTVQLREKSSTIQKITSLNTEIQSALSTLHHEPFSSELYQSRDFNLLPHDYTTKSNQKSLDFPRPQAEVLHKEEPKPSVSSGKKPTPSHQEPEERTVSGEALITPPQTRLLNKAKKEEQPKPQAVPFKAPPQIQTQPKQPENISIIHYEESKPSPSKIVAGKSKLHAKTNKNPFADEEELLESPNVVDESAVNYDQQFIEEPAGQQYGEYTEGQDEPLDEIAEAQDFFNDLSQQAQKEVHSGGLLNTSKQSKSSLRYSGNQAPAENTENQEGGSLTQEAAENFFDQLGNNPNPESPNETPAKLRQDPYQYNQPKPQVQAKPVHKGNNPFADEPQEEAPPVSQPQRQVNQQPPKKVVQSSIQKGKNPFADEQEDSSFQFQAPPRQVPQQTTKQLPPPRNIVPTSSHKGTNPFAEENEAEPQPPIQAKTVVRATPQRGKNPFEDEGETQVQGSEFFQQQTPQPQAQPRTQVPPQNRAQPFPKPGQPKAAIKRGNNPFADEEEEKNVQPQSQIQTQPPVQKYQQPPVQSKPVSRGPIQKGNNPFAEESESQNPFDTPEAGSFVDRPEVQRPNQPKTLPLQTGVAKKLDVQPSKGSALKKAKGVIPSNMFD